MPHISYIDSDEEIISVIARLRKAKESEICFVVPKRAVFLQSLVNLRLLEREARKCGKELSLVTSDPSAKALAQKAGIATKDSLEGRGVPEHLSDPNLPARLVPSGESGRAEVFQRGASDGRTDWAAPHSGSIGSASFFNQTEASDAHQEPSRQRRADSVSVVGSLPPLSFSNASPEVSPRSLPVRDRSPKRLTALNSLSQKEESPAAFVPPRPKAVSPSMAPPRPDMSLSSSDGEEFPLKKSEGPASALREEANVSGGRAAHGISFGFPSSPVPLAPPPLPPSHTPPLPPDVRPSISSWYRKNTEGVSESSLSSNAHSEVSVPRRKMLLSILGGFAFVSLLAIAGVLAFTFLPRAEATLVVEERSEGRDVEAVARLDQKSADTEKKILPLRLIESEKDVSLSFPGTGKSSASEKRTRGMVTISNAALSSPQTLVATTRLEASGGKIFRLVKGVTVPGATKSEDKTIPGTILAEVVADESGDTYNIEPTSFTVPGLKGGPKYESVTARSEKPFLGGGSGSGSAASVSADDVLRAKESIEKKLPELLRTDIEKDLGPGEKLLEDAMQWEVLSSGAFPGTGAVTSSFDYRVRVSLRAMVFSESDMRAVAARVFEKQSIDPESLSLDYTVPRPDFAAKTLVVKARASATMEHSLDAEAVKQKILGKSLPEVQKVFGEYPNIQKIEVVFWPQFMTSRIPGRPSQVTVTVKPAM